MEFLENSSSVSLYPACVIHRSLNATQNASQASLEEQLLWEDFDKTVYFINVIICACGVLSNTLNLIIFTRRRLLMSLDHLAKSANYGFAALALSDLMFCISALSHLMLMENQTFQKYSRIYIIGSINLFLMISTWITVSMAVNRFIVVIYPLHARQKVSIKGTLWTIVAVFIGSFLLTLPFFLHISVFTCRTQSNTLSTHFGSIWDDEAIAKLLRLYIKWFWPIVADFIPIGVLTFCNGRLMAALRTAIKVRKQTCRGQKVRDSNQTVTSTLITVVVMLLVLVSPAEVLRYINPYKKWGRTGHAVASIANMLQSLNFALNFIAYCIVSPDFRQTVVATFTCRSVGKYPTTTSRSACGGNVAFSQLTVKHPKKPCRIDKRSCSPVTDYEVVDDGL